MVTATCGQLCFWFVYDVVGGGVVVVDNAVILEYIFFCRPPPAASVAKNQQAITGNVGFYARLDLLRLLLAATTAICRCCCLFLVVAYVVGHVVECCSKPKMPKRKTTANAGLSKTVQLLLISQLSTFLPCKWPT